MARILVVEDDEPIRKLLKQVLVEVGHMVITAVDGYDGLRMSTHLKDQVDLLVTDNTMPGLSGVDMLGAMVMADCLPPRVLMVSGDFEADGIGAAFVRELRRLAPERVSFNMMFLPKPVKIDLFLETINTILGPTE